MKTTIFSLLAVLSLLAGRTAIAAVNDYQVTGPVLEVTDSMIAVEANKKDRWELKKDADTKGPADVKVGDKVTVHYTMTATKIEAKAAKAEKGAKKEKAKKDEKKEDTKKE